jgi:hypothetical protein
MQKHMKYLTTGNRTARKGETVISSTWNGSDRESVGPKLSDRFASDQHHLTLDDHILHWVTLKNQTKMRMAVIWHMPTVRTILKNTWGPAWIQSILDPSALRATSPETLIKMTCDLVPAQTLGYPMGTFATLKF